MAHEREIVVRALPMPETDPDPDGNLHGLGPGWTPERVGHLAHQVININRALQSRGLPELNDTWAERVTQLPFDIGWPMLRGLADPGCPNAPILLRSRATNRYRINPAPSHTSEWEWQQYPNHAMGVSASSSSGRPPAPDVEMATPRAEEGPAPSASSQPAGRTSRARRSGAWRGSPGVGADTDNDIWAPEWRAGVSALQQHCPLCGELVRLLGAINRPGSAADAVTGGRHCDSSWHVRRPRWPLCNGAHVTIVTSAAVAARIAREDLQELVEEQRLWPGCLWFRPRCLRCGTAWETTFIARSDMENIMPVHIFCHGCAVTGMGSIYRLGDRTVLSVLCRGEVVMEYAFLARPVTGSA
jgi:hypothetical protein